MSNARVVCLIMILSGKAGENLEQRRNSMQEVQHSNRTLELKLSGKRGNCRKKNMWSRAKEQKTGRTQWCKFRTGGIGQEKKKMSVNFQKTGGQVHFARMVSCLCQQIFNQRFRRSCTASQRGELPWLQENVQVSLNWEASFHGKEVSGLLH